MQDNLLDIKTKITVTNNSNFITFFQIMLIHHALFLYFLNDHVWISKERNFCFKKIIKN